MISVVVEVFVVVEHQKIHQSPSNQVNRYLHLVVVVEVVADFG